MSHLLVLSSVHTNDASIVWAMSLPIYPNDGSLKRPWAQEESPGQCMACQQVLSHVTESAIVSTGVHV